MQRVHTVSNAESFELDKKKCVTRMKSEQFGRFCLAMGAVLSY